MSILDLIYFLMLVLSIPLGHVVKITKPVYMKQLICLGSGLAIVLTLVGWRAMYHSLIVIVCNFFILKLADFGYQCHLISFVFVFGYLLFFRSCQDLGFETPPKHSNAVQLLVTLRMVGLAFEKNNFAFFGVKPSCWNAAQDFKISFLDTITYGYSFIGLMTGPFYKYQTFQDMLHQDGTKIATVMPALKNLKYLLFLGIPYLYLKSKFPLEYLGSVDFLEGDQGVLYSHFVVGCTNWWFRWRFHIGWLLAESMCMAAGLGAYPFVSKSKPGNGPTADAMVTEDQENLDRSDSEETHCFESIHNIKWQEVELATSTTQQVKIWNMTVQWWLQNYGRQIVRTQNRSVRTFGTVMLSAYWHGTYSGYYLTALVALFALIGDYMFEKVWRQLDVGAKQKYWLSWLRTFLTIRMFEFIAVPFMLLKFGPIFAVWRKLWFSGLVYCLLLISSPWIFDYVRRKLGGNSSSGEATNKKQE